MADTVSFKVYMSAEDGSVSEVRRFGVEADAVTNFLYVREKLQIIFPSLKGKHFTLSWRDDDNDDVVISSDEELQIALAETNTKNIRKLYVVLHSEYPLNGNDDPDLANSGPIHLNVVCDGCDKQIQGFRYKCMQCTDYDLCKICESHGKHSEHCMIRLPSPMQWSSHNARRLANHINRFVEKETYHAAKEKERRHCPFKGGRHHGRPRHCGGETKNWMDMFSNYLDDWANLPGECPMKKPSKESTESQKKAEPSKTKDQPSEDKKNYSCEGEKLINDVLSNVGMVKDFVLPYIADALLKPQVRIADPSAPQASKAGSSSSSHEDSSASESLSEKMKFNEAFASFLYPGKDKVSQGPSSDVKASAPAQSTPEQSSSPARSASPVQSAVPEQSPGPVESPPPERSDGASLEKEGWTVLNPSGTTTPSASAPAALPTGAIPKQTPAPVQPSPPQIQTPTPAVYPKLPEKVPDENITVFYHPNQKIQKAVERMIQMGFSNEGGWLTNLLASKDGDISAALDALSPVRR